MEFVQKFTPLDFWAKYFTPSISANFNSFNKKKHKKMSKNRENLQRWQKFYTAAALTAWTNSTSAANINTTAEETYPDP